MTTDKYLGSIEAGGTKFVVAVSDFEFNSQATAQFPTTTPEETLEKVITFFKQYEVAAIGIGSFGPVDINPHSATYGYILNTPKAGWCGFDFLGTLQKALPVPMYFTTDVNAAAYGEFIRGAGTKAKAVVYFTFGTGIGGGFVQKGKFISTISHAEMGHGTALPHPEDFYEGNCPFHGNRCFEGLASGPTIEGRTGIKGEDLPRTDQVFDYIAYYAGQLAFNTFINMVPEKIIFGGSVLQETDLPNIRNYFNKFNNGYIKTPCLEELIVCPQIKENGSATIGNFGLALNALTNQGGLERKNDE